MGWSAQVKTNLQSTPFLLSFNLSLLNYQQAVSSRLYRTSSMGNILSCYKVNKPDTCRTPTSNNQVVTPSVSFKADEGNVDQACENPKESDNFQGTPKFSKPAKDHTPLLSRGDSEAGHYSGRH
ncbi:unnamed protein product [Phytophthora lilii]|uniref:Unnamed protein product n=1 Tax=Phytophthora lilii TaxID=2077276 RepID=A0A9W6XBD1_9STRA|nr:unnamed protein product [Phytophthora lilii]